MSNINLIRKPFTRTQRFYNTPTTFQNVEIGIDPVQNPVLYEFETEVLTTSVVKSRLVIAFTGASALITAGTTLRIFNTTFTATANALQRNEMFTVANDAGTKKWATDLAFKLQTFLDSTKYDVFAVDLNPTPRWVVHIVAKTQSAEFNILPAGPGVGSPSLDWFISKPPTDTIIGSSTLAANKNIGSSKSTKDYRIFVEIYTINRNDILTNPKKYTGFQNITNNVVKRISTLSLPLNSQNSYVIDVSKYIRTELNKNKHFLSEYGNIVPLLDNTLVKPYYIRFGEEYKNADNVTQKIHVDETETRFAFDAIIDPYLANDTTNSSDFRKYWSIYNSVGDAVIEDSLSALTTQPDSVMIRRYERPFLSWIYRDDNRFSLNNNGYYQIVYTFLDGTTVTSNTSFFNMKESGVYKWNVPTNIQNIENSNNKKILFFEIEVGVVRSNVISGTKVRLFKRKYVLDTQIKENYEKLTWVNDFGVFDSFDFEGTLIQNNKNNTKDYQKSSSLEAGYIADISKINAYNTESVTETTLNSGYVTKEQAEWLYKISKSFYVYKVLNYNSFNVLKQIKIKDVELTTNSTSSLYNVKVEYTEYNITRQI
jgi:hypothetical protein